MVKEVCGRVRARSGGLLPCLTNRGDQTKTTKRLTCADSYQTLPRASRSCARGANQLGGFGLVQGSLPGVTNWPFWLHRRSIVVLPIITSRGVKYTHNDRDNDIPHPDSGPTRMGLVHPERHQSLEVDRHHTHDPASTHGPGPAVLTPRPRRTAVNAQILCAKQVNLVKIW